MNDEADPLVPLLGRRDQQRGVAGAVRLRGGRLRQRGVVEQAALQLVARLRMIGAGQCARRQIAIELGELVATDAGVDLSGCGFVLGVPALPGPQQQQHREGDHACRSE